MAIKKAKVTSNYVTIPNSSAQDKNLSFEARGLLTLMLSMPDDWVMHRSWLMDQSAGCGRDKMTRILKELEDNGYLIRHVKQTETGKMNGWDWEVYPSPVNTDERENRHTENPSVGKPAPTKETSLQSKQSTKETVNTKEKATSDKKPFSLPEKLNLEAWSLWNEYRKQQGFKPYKQVALGEGAAASKLIELAGGDTAKQLAIVNQSISNQWKGLFALKAEQLQKSVIRQSGFTASDKPSCKVGKI